MVHPQQPSTTPARPGRRRATPVPVAAPAFAAALAALAFLLFCWPFVMSPAPSFEAATSMVFAAWCAVVGALWLVARAVGRPASGSDEHA